MEVMNNLYAVIAGLVVEAVYFIVGDLVIGRLFDYEVMPFYAYIFFAGVVGLSAMIYCGVHAERTSQMVKMLIAVLSAAFLHIYCLLNDTAVYNLLHAEAWSEVDDLGYVFFILYLGIVYFIWILAAIMILIRQRKKDRKKYDIDVVKQE